MNTTPKLCKDCRHHHATETAHRCHHPTVSGGRVDLVTGDATPFHCSTERGGETGATYPCGASGALWEAKEVQS